jgi:acyl-coenzyme A synthetase/AMP-(fatty) acid ligase/acyl carrier protein
MEETGGGWRILQYAATGFDVSMQETLYSLASGSTLYVSPQTMRYDMPVLAEFILRHRIEMITLPFSALNLLFRENAMFKGDSPLRHIITSGEALRVFPELRRFLEERPQVKLHNQYGPTETHVVTAHTISAEQGNITEYPPIGRPVSNTEILILDQGLKPVPAGIIGEIYAAGDNLARGYLNRDDLTRERFIPHPFEKDGRMYRTGDIGRWFKDGTIEFLGRNDDQVKIRGYRVELGEIETCLLRHPDIREAVVLARKVQGETELAAYVSGPEKLGPADMRTHLKKFLPFYMIPAHIIRVDGFQFTAHGKVDKKSLPDPSRMEPIHPEYIPPRTEIEKRITEIWESVLGVQKAGLSDNFFESGGHSLKAAQMAGRIRKEMRVDLPLREIFTNPVLESLAAYIARAQAVSDEPIEPADDILPATGEEIRVLKKLLEGN